MAAWCGSLALVALTVIIACAGALPLNAQATTRGSRPDNSRVTINKYTNQPNTGNGEYRYEFELSDGTRRFEEGSLTGPGGSLLVHGSFSRPAFDGTMEQVMYYADEEGFHLARMLPPLLGGPSASLIASLVG